MFNDSSENQLTKLLEVIHNSTFSDAQIDSDDTQFV